MVSRLFKWSYSFSRSKTFSVSNRTLLSSFKSALRRPRATADSTYRWLHSSQTDAKWRRTIRIAETVHVEPYATPVAHTRFSL